MNKIEFFKEITPVQKFTLAENMGIIMLMEQSGLIRTMKNNFILKTFWILSLIGMMKKTNPFFTE